MCTVPFVFPGRDGILKILFSERKRQRERGRWGGGGGVGLLASPSATHQKKILLLYIFYKRKLRSSRKTSEDICTEL